MELLIYYHRHRAKTIVREDISHEELAECDDFTAAKRWVSEHYPGATTFHAGPGGTRELKWVTTCKCCGREFEKPYLK